MEQYNPTLEAAIGYADLYKWNLFPLWPVTKAGKCGCSNPDCKRAGKHPSISAWQHNASREPNQLAKWWGTRPGYGIGLNCGASGVFVLDIDPRHNGDDSLAQIKRDNPDTSFDTVTCITGGGGEHLYFKYNNQHVTTGSGMWPGIDFRHYNGFVVLPPSTHENGREYEWETGRAPFDIPLLEMPAVLQEKITYKPKWTPNGTIHDGYRNDTLVSLAGKLRYLGLVPEAIYAALVVQAKFQCENPDTVSESELRAMALSVGKYAPGGNMKPRNQSALEQGW